jgi:hypothetical protein
MLIVAVLFATVLLRFTLIGAVVYFILPRGPACPRCALATTPIRHQLFHRLVPALEHRWCLECGWSGLVRRGDAARRQSRVINRTARS